MLLEVDNLSKKYSRSLARALKYGLHDSLREILPGRRNTGRLRPGEFWALRNVTFRLGPGDRLGILGRNGAGKTTLMRVVSGLLVPDGGQVAANGSIDQMLELTSGFHPMMTGLQNARLRARLAGLTEKEFRTRLDAIVEFTGLGSFINSPVRFYSSGMKARLGFALSTMRKSDILIIDEAMAVGDLDFRLKCYEFIAEYLQDTALLFVSHSLGQVKRFCNQAIVMERGRVLFHGDVQSAIELYQDTSSKTGDVAKSEGLNPERLQFSLHGPSGELDENDALPYGEPLAVRIVPRSLPEDATYSINLSDSTGRPLATWSSSRSGFRAGSEAPLVCRLGPVRLSSGYYRLNVAAHDAEEMALLAYAPWARLRVIGEMVGHAPFLHEGEWGHAISGQGKARASDGGKLATSL